MQIKYPAIFHIRQKYAVTRHTIQNVHLVYYMVNLETFAPCDTTRK